jgi:RNA 2',3'-cyclic 3'-phosphodiesterase
MRVFIGVKASLAAIADMTAAVDSLRPAADRAGLRVRWVCPATYHVTLKFLGEVRAAALAAIRDAVGNALADSAGFSFSLGTLGAFPARDRARVLWVGVQDGARELTRLAELCDRAVEPLGFARERRPFHAHVTLGRLKEVANIEPLMVALPAEHRFSDTAVGELNLFESAIKPDGSEYTARASWLLRQSGQVQPEPRTDD